MEDRSRNIVVGVTALAGVVGFTFLLMLFGRLPTFMESGYELRVELPAAAGLQVGSVVKLSGIDVGRVVSIDFQSPPKRGVVARLRINEGIAIPRDTVATVVKPIFAGSPHLAFDVRHLDDTRFADTLPTDGTGAIAGKEMSLFGDLGEKLGESLDNIRNDIRQPLERFANMEQRFDALSRQWEQVGVNLNDMLERRSVAQVQAGEAQPNLTTLIERSDQRMAEIRQLLDAMHQWLAAAQTTTEKLGVAADGVSDTAERVGGTADEAKTQFEQLSRRYIAVADDLSGLLGQTEQLVRQARDGQGTMGRLITDPRLYENFNDSVERIGLVMDELQLMIQKWNAEGVPIQF
jgi:phospholipid/cholesterol/gamma-HCH transport system substrate-binding protein